MILSELVFPISYEQASGLALVFAPELAVRLAQLHKEYGNSNCVPSPRLLSDGRFMLCADILTEVASGGLLYPMWEQANKTVLLANVQVVPMSEVLPLLVNPDPEDYIPTLSVDTEVSVYE